MPAPHRPELILTHPVLRPVLRVAPLPPSPLGCCGRLRAPLAVPATRRVRGVALYTEAPLQPPRLLPLGRTHIPHIRRNLLPLHALRPSGKNWFRHRSPVDGMAAVPQARRRPLPDNFREVLWGKSSPKFTPLHLLLLFPRIFRTVPGVKSLAAAPILPSSTAHVGASRHPFRGGQNKFRFLGLHNGASCTKPVPVTGGDGSRSIAARPRGSPPTPATQRRKPKQRPATGVEGGMDGSARSRSRLTPRLVTDSPSDGTSQASRPAGRTKSWLVVVTIPPGATADKRRKVLMSPISNEDGAGIPSEGFLQSSAP